MKRDMKEVAKQSHPYTVCSDSIDTFAPESLHVQVALSVSSEG